MTREGLVPQIKPPMYYLFYANNDYPFVLNEYELRSLMVRVKKSQVPRIHLLVMDDQGNTAEFNVDGTLTRQLHGLDLAANLTLQLL
jgi:hypothetical protein